MGLSGILCAVQAGTCAALASASGKFAASSQSSSTLAIMLQSTLADKFDIEMNFERELAIAARLIGVAGIFLFNALMWVLFTKSMHLCSSTLEATAFNTASNFFFTAVLGRMLFGELLGLQWYIGSVLMVLGLVLLHKGSNAPDTVKPLQEDATYARCERQKLKAK